MCVSVCMCTRGRDRQAMLQLRNSHGSKAGSICVAGEDFKLDKSLSVGTCPVLDPLIHPLTLSF